ncbi:MAG: alanine--glyoxylate aminotransferase family protein [Oligoflexia bacterium]|nr:alanine--glyoxylate aminotransferase family protein [Oligoflexia bacterium]
MKKYLMAPGPSQIPEQVLLEMAKPIIHHRTKEFEAVLEKVKKQLQFVFQTKNDVLLHASVGSGAMESSVVNFFSKGDKVIVVRSGKFGERWSEQAKIYGLEVINLDVEWGNSVDINDVKKLLEKEKNVKGIFTQICETSTGVHHDVKALGELIKKHPQTLMLVDGITAIGVSNIKTDDWGLDVVISGSQKAFMLPPGLSMMSVSTKALKFAEQSTLPKYYFNVLKELEMLAKNQTHFTPAISLIQGLSVSLDMIFEEGLENVFDRHEKLAQATREGVKALGLKLFAQNPSNSITAVYAPQGIDGEKIVEHMFKKYGFTIIGGQDHVKGKIFRLGHMGYCSIFDVVSMLKALEFTLKDLGYKKEN